MIAVEVRHATLHSHDRGSGPARHTELTQSQLRSGTPHCTHMVAREDEEDDEEEEEEEKEEEDA